ncbi:hypothetical protein AB6E04_08095 [Vibrio amylolyticus]|uniref:hypothetical protein n=1 Tax=Vibrio amylolyticus TaxID=2847292 RepID=UPI00354CF0AE
MSAHLIKLFWLTILALLMPSQAFAYLAKSDQALNGVQTTPATVSQGDVSFLTLEGSLPSEQSIPDSPVPKPVSQSEVSDSAIAIINSNRWLSSSSTIEETNDRDSEFFDALTHLPHYKQVFQFSYSSFGDAFASEHRISGWKESNALYVALNSQF